MIKQPEALEAQLRNMSVEQLVRLKDWLLRDNKNNKWQQFLG